MENADRMLDKGGARILSCPDMAVLQQTSNLSVLCSDCEVLHATPVLATFTCFICGVVTVTAVGLVTVGLRFQPK